MQPSVPWRGRVQWHWTRVERIPRRCTDDVPCSGRFAHLGVDDTKTGERVLEELAKQVGDQGKVAILGGNL